MNYLVLEDRPRNSAVVHRVGCNAAKDQHTKAAYQGVWHGPFSTENVALAAAKRTRLSSVRSCGRCFR